MIIDWKEFEDKEHVTAWLILEAMSETGIDKFGKFDSSRLDVEMRINGIEVDIIPALEFLQKQLGGIKEGGFKEGVEHAALKLQENIDQVLDINNY
jgi:hypothetical protein